MHEDESTALTTPRASLSRISCNTRYTIALNQIDRIDVRETYDRVEDGVTMYVLDVYLLCVQTGIPTSSRAKRASKLHRHHKWFRRKTSEHGGEHDEQEDEAEEEEDSKRRVPKDPLLRKREREKTPHYRVAYRFSEFVQLRKELREIVDAPDETLHSKWCSYCARLYWLVKESPFPSRYVPLLDTLVNRVAWLKRWRVRRRKRKLQAFLKEIVMGARSMQYRVSGDQCDGFLNTAFVLKEFLSEPQMRQSFTGW